MLSPQIQSWVFEFNLQRVYKPRMADGGCLDDILGSHEILL